MCASISDIPVKWDLFQTILTSIDTTNITDTISRLFKEISKCVASNGADLLQLLTAMNCLINFLDNSKVETGAHLAERFPEAVETFRRILTSDLNRSEDFKPIIQQSLAIMKSSNFFTSAQLNAVLCKVIDNFLLKLGNDEMEAETNLQKLGSIFKYLPRVKTTQHLQDKLTEIPQTLIQLTKHSNERICSVIVYDTLPQLEVHLSGDPQIICTAMFQSACEGFNHEDHYSIIENNQNCYIILYAIADKLFPSILHSNIEGGFADTRKCPQFWLIIQKGLVHQNPTTRKRAMYLFKRAVECSCYWTEQDALLTDSNTIFWWSHNELKKLKQYYEDLILILETLEEKQVHVIKPVLPRLLTLRAATDILTKDGNKYYLHSSWILVVFERLFSHENTSLKKSSLVEMMTIDLNSFPLFTQKMENFIFHVLIPSLNDTSLFVRQHEPWGSCPLVGQNIANFYAACYNSLQPCARKDFFRKLLYHMCQQSWGSVPLLYMCRGLALLPKDLFWDSRAFGQLQELVAISTRTQEIPIRTAIQYYVLLSLITSTDISSIQVSDLVSVLAKFKSGESFHRQTIIWNKIAEWIGNTNLGDEWKLATLTFCSSSLDIDAEGTHNGNPQSTIRFMCLLADSHLLDNERIKAMLKPMVYTLRSSSGRCYMPTEKVDTCLRILITFWQESIVCEGSQLTELPDKLIDGCFEEILDCITRRIFGDRKNAKQLPDLDLYIQFLSYAARRGKLCFPPGSVLVQDDPDPVKIYVWVKWLALHSEHALTSTFASENKNKALSTLAQMIEQGCLENSLPKLQHEDMSELDLANWARRVSDHQSNLWFCAKLYMSSNPEKCYANLITSQATSALEIAGISSLSAIFSTLELVLPKVTEDKLISVVLQSGWKHIFEFKHNKSFWKALQSFICAAFQPQFMLPPIDSMLTQFAMDLSKRSEFCSTLFYPLVQHVCRYQAHTLPLSSNSFLNIIVTALTFGPVHHKDQRVFRDSIDFLSSVETGNILALVECHHLDHLLVRVTAICFLLQLHPSLECHVKFTDMVIEGLLEQEKIATKSRSRHFGNSWIHRIKNRCWQTILLLEPFMTQERAKFVYEIIVEMLIEENLQISVRYLVEWIASRFLLRFRDFRDLLWANIGKAAVKRVGSLGSFFSILSHLIQLGSAKSGIYDQEELSLRAVTEILPWCMSQQCNARLSAHMAFNKIWEVNEQLQNLSFLERFKPIHQGLNSALMFRNRIKNIPNVKDDFYWNAFHPSKHFTVQTIFYELPRLSNLVDEEWLNQDLFNKVLDSEMKLKSFISLLNLSDELSRFQPSTYISKYGEAEALDIFGGCEPYLELGDVQKKITPWKQMLKDPESLLGLSDFQIAKKKFSRDKGLVVVASLLDRPPNLGGLCRTCEVLGATEYILHSLMALEDKQFSNLSVSSERWIPIREVKKYQLKEYLDSMKQCGYTVIGAEQTTQSISLSELKFPKKTLLLLGNEKEGIPVDLIQLLDICVEIPQIGVIRSLNVHVTGAIIIWEYARQYPQLE